MSQQPKAVVIYSGGMDSYTVLHRAKADGYEVHALSFNYGQRHSKELECAAKVCESSGIEHKIIDISAINELMQGSALTSDIDVPEGHYADENMKQTVVPNRNMILLSMAAAYAMSIKAEAIFYGAHAGDHDIYPDCRESFVNAMSHAIEQADWQFVELKVPYLHGDKATILKEGFGELGLDYKNTWTCYNGREKACGKCGACIERVMGFIDNGKVDPVEYEEGWEAVVARAESMRQA